jgi:hypothetical protein
MHSFPMRLFSSFWVGFRVVVGGRKIGLSRYEWRCRVDYNFFNHKFVDLFHIGVSKIVSD